MHRKSIDGITLPASAASTITGASAGGNLFKMKRKNSRRLSLKKPPTAGGGGTPAADIQRSASGRELVKGSTIYDILRSDRKSSAPAGTAASPLIKDLGQLALTRRTADEIYRKNYKIYDKLISYGSKAYKRYDKYMTYGTIYEILHRKSDAAEDVFLRKRALSEKYAKRKVGGTATHYGSVKLLRTCRTCSVIASVFLVQRRRQSDEPYFSLIHVQSTIDKQ